MKVRIGKALLGSAVVAVALTGCSTVSKNTAAVPVPAPIAAAPAPSPAPAKVMVPARAPAAVYVIHDVDFDKSTPKSVATAGPDHAVADLARQSGVRDEVVGFTDSSGSDAYSQRLSERRAVAVRDNLVAHGVAAEQLAASGRGEANPIASNGTGSGRAQNRRVEIRPRG